MGGRPGITRVINSSNFSTAWRKDYVGRCAHRVGIVSELLVERTAERAAVGTR